MSDLNHYFINRKLTRGKLMEFLNEYRTDGYTLDIGCGDQLYKELFPNSICVDIDGNRNPDVIADVHNMNQLWDNVFDCILCTEVLEHCYDPWRAADEMFRVLKPNGILLVSTRFVYPLHDTPQDYYRFTKYGLKHLFRNYHLLELREEAAPIETMGILYQRLAFQTELKKPFSRLLWFFLAEFYGRKRKKLIQYGNLRHAGKPENIITSGYYMALQKPEPNGGMGTP